MSCETCLPAHTASHAWHGFDKVVQPFHMLRLKKALSLVAVSICLPCFSEVILQHARSAPESCASSRQTLISLPCKAFDVVLMLTLCRAF